VWKPWRQQVPWQPPWKELQLASCEAEPHQQEAAVVHSEGQAAVQASLLVVRAALVVQEGLGRIQEGLEMIQAEIMKALGLVQVSVRGQIQQQVLK